MILNFTALVGSKISLIFHRLTSFYIGLKLINAAMHPLTIFPHTKHRNLTISPPISTIFCVKICLCTSLSNFMATDRAGLILRGPLIFSRPSVPLLFLYPLPGCLFPPNVSWLRQLRGHQDVGHVIHYKLYLIRISGA